MFFTLISVVFFLSLSGDASAASAEHAIAQAKASVMLYDDATKKWMPAGGGAQGFSKVYVYAHDTNNTFRVVGRKIADHEVGTLVLTIFATVELSCETWHTHTHTHTARTSCPTHLLPSLSFQGSFKVIDHRRFRLDSCLWPVLQ